MLRDNHYDLAFRAYLRARRIPHVAVDESRRALMRNQSLKSIDFIVSPPGKEGMLVDVKGRRFPGGKTSKGNRWENWVTADDIESLLHWQEIFGTGFRSALIFVYDLTEPSSVSEFSESFRFRDRQYACCGVWADEYQVEMRERSASWKTVALPRRSFHELRYPLGKLLGDDLPELEQTTDRTDGNQSVQTNFESTAFPQQSAD